MKCVMFHLYISLYSLPWNQECFFGYIGEIVADVIIFNITAGVDFHMLLLLISLCAHFFTFNDMFASLVNELDNSTEEKNQTGAIQKLIEFHLDIKGYERLHESKIYAIWTNCFAHWFFNFQIFLRIECRIQCLSWRDIHLEQYFFGLPLFPNRIG